MMNPVQLRGEQNLVVCTPAMTAATAAKVMRSQHAAAVLVVDRAHGPQQSGVQLVTDRDLVVHGIAVGLDLGTITVGDLAELVGPVEPALARHLAGALERSGVRQLPCVTDDGAGVQLIPVRELFTTRLQN